MVTRCDDRGFTLLEVMIALLIGMIGLIGSLAVLQTIMRVSSNANDASVAMRLAAQQMEQFSAKVTSPGPPVDDELAAYVTATATCPNVRCPACAGTPPGWCRYWLDATGRVFTSNKTSQYRWRLEWTVANVPNTRYDISVKVFYDLDTGNERFVQLDSQRMKTW